MEREQIIKALECWASGNPCEGSCCPLFEISPDTCDRWIGRNALSLINELTEENKRLKLAPKIGSVPVPEALEIINKYCESYIKKAKAYTVRKMQERLDKHFCHDPAFLGVEQRLIMDVINQIAKDMVEGAE